MKSEYLNHGGGIEAETLCGEVRGHRMLTLRDEMGGRRWVALPSRHDGLLDGSVRALGA